VSEAIRVLLVDDHAVVRAGLRTVLESDPGFRVVAEAPDTAEAVRLAGLEGPEVVLLDITMPGVSGLDAVPRLRQAAPRARILMLSVHDEVEYVLQAVRAGAHGYLRKDTTPSDLRQAVRAVHRGGAFFSPDVARHLTAAIRGEARPPSTAPVPPAAGLLETLTGRERDVLVRIARGLTNKEAAAELAISVRTVETHRDSLMRKLGIRTVAGLTRLALEVGLLNES